MKIGLVGLGKMGYNLALNLLEHGHDVVAYDKNGNTVEQITKDGATGVHTLNELVSALPQLKVVWVMVPAGKITSDVIDELKELLEPGDIIIDGGNSNYKESMARAEYSSKASCPEIGSTQRASTAAAS